MNSLVEASLADEPTSSAAPLCRHCALPVPHSRRDLGGAKSLFCCNGCEGVYHFIQKLGLQQFYTLRERSWIRDALPQTKNTGKFTFLDDPNLTSTYVERVDQSRARVRFYLEGIHCAACVWLLEKLPLISGGIISSTVQLASGSVTLEYNSAEIPLSAVASTLQSLGYLPHPIAINAPGHRGKEFERDMLLRIGVAGVAVSNTMLYAVSLYQGWFTGMESRFVNYFNFASLVLCIPAVFYSAVPLYKRALSGLRARLLHIDLPLSLAIILAFFTSAVNTFRGESSVYYDTISMLIFLLLVARFLQFRSLQAANEATNLEAALVPLSAHRKNPESGDEEEVYVGSIIPGDELLIPPGERIPVDGVVCSGSSLVHEAILTGEPDPISVQQGSKVLGGSVNLASALRIRASTTSREGHAGKILELLELADRRKSRTTLLTDRASGYFITAILFLASCSAIGWGSYSGIDAAINNTLALLVITCPCALGLAAPIAFSLAARRALAEGLFIRGSDTIERLSDARSIFLDKTGTLTHGQPRIIKLWHDGLPSFELQPIEAKAAASFPRAYAEIIAALEAETRHPYGRELLSFAGCPPANCSAVHSIDGGVKGELRGQSWLIGSLQTLVRNGAQIPAELHGALDTEQGSAICLAKDRECIAAFLLRDTVRAGMQDFISSCHRRGLRTVLISGDNAATTEAVRSELGIIEAHGDLRPEEKCQIVEEATRVAPTVMVGDGANDAAALKTASVGVGVSGGAEICLSVADVFVACPSSASFLRLFAGAARTMRVIRVNLGFSAAYNLIGASAALAGLVNPLLAAVLMPLSSLTVVGLSLVFISFDKGEN